MKRWVHRQKKTQLFTILAGLGAFLISLVIFSLALALIAYTSDDPASLTGAFSIIALMLSAAVMGVTVSLIAHEGALSACAICSLLQVVLMLIAQLCVNRFRISAPFIINCACAVGVAMIATKLVKGKGRRKMRIRRI